MKSFRKGASCFLAALLAGSAPLSILATSPQNHAVVSRQSDFETSHDESAVLTSFMDGFKPMPIIGELKDDIWGVPLVGRRDPDNGLEDRTLEKYCYWDGTILKNPEDQKYYMFASRWNESEGHGGWGQSSAIYAVSDNLEGPYTDMGELWPDYYEGAGHNVFAFEVSKSDPLYAEGYRYAISVSDTGKHGDVMNGSLHVAKSITGPWEHLGVMNTDGKFRLSNISIVVRPDGTYEAIGRDGDIATSSTLRGPWKTERQKLWWDIDGLDTGALEDPVIWYADGMYHVVVNHWDNKYAYYMTSYDGIQGWTLHNGPAYTPSQNFLQYTDGTENNWTKLERPGVYIEDGTLKAITFAVIDCEKEVEYGNDDHGSKIIVVPYDGKALAQFAKNDEYEAAPAGRRGQKPLADSHIQSWGDEASRNYGSEAFMQVQGNSTQGVLGEGARPDSGYDCKIGFMRFNLEDFALDETASNLNEATLSVVYEKAFSTGNTEDSLKVAVANNEWIAGNGKDGSSSTIENSMTWNNQPEVYADYGTAVSESFKLADTYTEIKIPVSDLIKAYKEKNPEAAEITLAISTVNGSRLHLGASEEGANAHYAPRLSVKAGTPVEGVALSKTELRLEPGESASLVATVSPDNATNKKVIFTSDNPHAVSVDENGNISANARGAAGITARTIDGDFKATCIVTVAPKEAYITGFAGAEVITANGIDANLPETVIAAWSDGHQSEEKVTWNAEEANLAASGIIKGRVEGADVEATCKITAYAPNMAWVIDCNNPTSPRHASANEIAQLKNETPDQMFDAESENAWGRVADYGVHDSSNPNDSYDQGWYSKAGEAIEYALPAEAGKYRVTFGFKEWWSQWTAARKMSAYVKEGETKTTLGTVNTWNGNNPWATFGYNVTVNETGTIRLGVEKQSGQPDPTLSFIEVQRVLNLDALKTAINTIKTLDLSAAPASTKAELEKLHDQAIDLALKSGTTQEQIDQAAETINALIAKIQEGGSFSEEEIEANDRILYLYNAGTPDSSVIPNDIKRGLYQSNVAQNYGTDPVSGLAWGLEEDGKYCIVSKRGDNAADMAETMIYMSTSAQYEPGKSGFHFRFELPERINNDYEVTIGVKNPWDTRPLDVVAEGETIASDISLTKGKLVEKTMPVEVTDGELNLFIHNADRSSQYDDPMVSYIIVKARSAWTKEQVQAKLDEQAAAMENRTFAKDSLDAYNTVADQARELISQNNPAQSALRDMLKKLDDAFNSLKETFTYTSFNGTKSAPWVDNNGNHIQGHGGSVQKLMIDGKEKWAWYGEDRSMGYTPMPGVHLYTSDDLYNWTDEGIVLRTVPVSDEDYGHDQDEGYKADLSIFEEDEYFSALYGDYKNQPAEDTEHYENKAEETYWNLANDRGVMERPKVIYNETTGKYVMWYHSDGRMPGSSGSYGRARAGIAISDKATGPFKLISTARLYDSENAPDHGFDGQSGGAVRDMNLFKDKNGEAYVLYSSDGNETMYIARLNEEYTAIAKDTDKGIDGTGWSADKMDEADYTRNFVKSSREAPAMFTYNGKYYLMTSGCTGWDPNQAQYAMADHPMGPWTVMGDPCVGDDNHTTFSTQSTSIFPVDEEEGKFIYMGDRWNRNDLGNSPYVWLPLEFDQNGKMILRDYADWTLDDLNDKGVFTLETKLPETCDSAANIRNILPDEVTISIGSQKYTKAVEWNVSNEDETILGIVGIDGTLEDGRTLHHEVSIVNPKTLYFFDCAKDGESSYFSTLDKELSTLVNESADPLYAPGKGGRVSLNESENADDPDLGTYGGGDLFASGWYAKSKKVITYRMPLNAGEYTLHAGFREWWNVTRPMTITIKNGDTAAAEKQFTLEGSDRWREEDLDFVLEQDGEIEVTISGRNNLDPVLCWLGVTDKNEIEVPEELNFTILDYVLDFAKKLDLNIFNAASQESGRQAIEDAQTKRNEAKSQEEIDGASKNLNRALLEMRITPDSKLLEERYGK